MRCKWSNTTTQLLWNIIRASSPGGIGRKPSLSTSFLRSSSSPGLGLTFHRFQFTSALSCVAHPASFPVAAENAPEKASSAQAQLSAVQLSRAACNAVCLSLQNQVGGLEDAYLIVNSLRFSSIRNDPLRFSQLESDYASNIIDFGREVSPRLSSHALLHGLLRAGHTDRASRLANMMMETGVRLRSKTLEAVFHNALTHPPGNRFSQSSIPAPPPFNVMLNQSQLSDLSSMARGEGTRAALQILDAARRTHYGRTRGMFGTLITICLINGEIILASLIFGFLTKDWQQKKSFAVRLHETTGVDCDKSLAKGRVSIPRYPVFPTPVWLKQILSPINDTLSSDGNDEVFMLSFTSALQALAYLAVLLDHHQLPFPNLAPLIRSLYNCPRIDDEVWIVNAEGHPQRVKAYPYFHDVLQRLVEALPTKNNRRGQMLYELDLASLNSLLHYTLRHRLSPTHSEKILQHMMERRIPLKPDVVTYNILLRSGTIIRQDSIVQKALENLNLKFGRHESRIQQTSVPRTTHGYELVSKRTPQPPDTPGLSLQGRTVSSSTPQMLLEADSHTISSYITYLSSTGQPRLVVKLVFEIFPEIQPFDNAHITTLSPSDIVKMRKRARTECVKRAVKLGPYVLTALLSALFNAGKTGLVKWVWRLAREAERMSWRSEFVPGAHPWFIPVHAYTTRLQCSRLEHRKVSLVPASFRKAWSPQESRKHLLHVGHSLYRLLKSMTRRAQVAVTSGTLPKNVAIPLSDIRFFNAILALFVLRRGQRRSRAHYRHNFKRAQHHHAYLGKVSPHWDPLLQEVGEDMIRAGYAIPPGLRHLFIGHWDQGTWNLERPPEFDRRPFAYPSNPLPRSPLFHIPTYRSKGLGPRRKRSKSFTDVVNM